MQTRCPACDTTFRVTAEQLKAKQGNVRCGQCRHVFNALTTLLGGESPSDKPAEGSLPAAQDEAPRTEHPIIASSAAAAEATYHLEPADEALLHEAVAVQSRSWLWMLLVLAASAVLLLQAAVQFRTELSVLFPEAKTALQATCALFGCKLALPHKPELLAIEASDLHPDQAHRLVLSATLKNRAAFVQAYPDLELSLTDIGDRPLIRKVIAPNEYLRKDTDAAKGFAASSEIALYLTIETEVGDAAGYRIYLFYP